ncbi:ribosome biogenesis/translation initiation ATPase RLI [Haladaptatus sp. F3-133]|uniref:Ribosome biogenesis/translation initiation ATPase RLI n=1 Tax=Halorutilus salinus TaxID=2487751 RepID=A0A9Q4GK50_9EURY|nr:ribosome biogenesis/translation initiation ATPase RLI [Halorutilus salinus]MCX2819846.1 ribosome biogenesis/translation initiation ATPase RLI [Halorutilus salinus]
MSDIIAVVDDEKCNPNKCEHECINFDPLNRSPTGADGFHIDDETGKARISESVVMEGHRVCATKCPFDAIQIVNLEKETGEKLHQYGENGFRLYGLPAPKEGKVVGVLGRNGTGKSTALRILAGDLKPNLGEYDDGVGWDNVVTAHRGTELQTYFERLAEEGVVASSKIQRVDEIQDAFGGRVDELLEQLDERGNVGRLVETLDMEEAVSKDVGSLSGGELQRVAVAGCLARDADVYLLDEPSSFLDVKQRLNVARAIRNETADADGDRRAVVVEHDLATLDVVADLVHVAHGEPGAYGMISNAMSSRVGVNQYLRGYLKSHNLRIRDEEITFERGTAGTSIGETVVEYPTLQKKFGSFELNVESGDLREGDVVGVLGENAIGKSTFVKMLAGELEPDNTSLDAPATFAHKPQHLEAQDVKVEYLLMQDVEMNQRFESFVERPLGLDELYDRNATDLSGGELQRVGVAACLGQQADVYLLDEPSAYLDVETRVSLAKTLRRFARDAEVPVVVIDHDLVFLDYIADRAMVFDGEPGVRGHAGAPDDVSDGFNDFLSTVDMTFRKDPDTGRPRANKPGSQKDREQRQTDEFYE